MTSLLLLASIMAISLTGPRFATLKTTSASFGTSFILIESFDSFVVASHIFVRATQTVVELALGSYGISVWCPLRLPTTVFEDRSILR